MLDDALVEALVAPAQQRDRRLGRELVDEGVVEHPAAGGQRDDAPLAAQVDRVDAVEAAQRGVHDVDAQHHPGAAAERRVVDLAAGQRRVVARVEGAQLVAAARGRCATWRWPRNHSNQSGNRVTTSSCIRQGLAQELRSTSMRARLDVDRRARRRARAGPAGRRALAGSTSSTSQDGSGSSRRTRPDRRVAVDDGAAREVLGVPLVLRQRRARRPGDEQLLPAQRLDRLAGRRGRQAQDRAASVPERRTISRWRPGDDARCASERRAAARAGA